MNDYWNETPGLGARLVRVRAIMEETVRDPSFPLREAVAEIALSQGKMLRPAFLLIGSGFGRPMRGAASMESIERLAAAIELLHTATLIHDDVLDSAELRRGLPTMHTRFGTVEAVLAGDWLLARCFRLASENAGPENARLLSRLVGTVCSAEIAQDMGKFSYTTSVRSNMRTIAGKTAALFSLALHTGAAENKAQRRTVSTLRRVGYCVGMAFQVIDDILDFESTEGIMGKPVGKDIKEGLCTLPLIHALRMDPDGMRSLLDRVRADESLIPEIIERTFERGGIDYARTVAHRFTDRARREIKRLPANESRRELSILTEKLLTRTY